MNLLIEDIGELVTAAGSPDPGDASIPAEARLGLCHDGAVLIRNGRVAFAGLAAELPRQDLAGIRRVSAGGRLVTPGLCDPHTHPIWAGERSLEFDLRNQGQGYAAIQAAGGGILATVRATDAATDDELRASTRARLRRLLAQGVTSCEAKTGYGLRPAAELRLLDLLTSVQESPGPRLSPTFLCHVPPPGLSAEERAALVADLEVALPRARAAGADAVDVYCDVGAFTLAETESLLRAGRAAGLLLRCHAEQFTHTGAAALAAGLGARSVEHLEEISDADVAALRTAGTVANLLPGAALTLRLRWPDGRRLLDAGIPVALGTDLNPGSSLTESLPLMMTLACTQMGLTCAEAFLGVTAVAARSIGDPDAGRLCTGSHGDVVLWEAERYREVCQHFGVPLVHAVYVGGAPV